MKEKVAPSLRSTEESIVNQSSFRVLSILYITKYEGSAETVHFPRDFLAVKLGEIFVFCAMAVTMFCFLFWLALIRHIRFCLDGIKDYSS